MAYLGHCSTSIENLIHVCKAATMFQKIRDLRTGELVDVPFDAVARIIGTINKETANTLASCFRTVRRRTAFRSDCEQRGIIPYCENPHISLHQFGILYRAVLIPQDLQLISPAPCHPSNNSPLRETDQFKDWNLSANSWHFSSCSVCIWRKMR